MTILGATTEKSFTRQDLTNDAFVIIDVLNFEMRNWLRNMYCEILRDLYNRTFKWVPGHSHSGRCDGNIAIPYSPSVNVSSAVPFFFDRLVVSGPPSPALQTFIFWAINFCCPQAEETYKLRMSFQNLKTFGKYNLYLNSLNSYGGMWSSPYHTNQWVWWSNMADASAKMCTYLTMFVQID